MRPTYETEDDAKREGHVADALQRAWGVTVQKCPTKYALDRALIRGGKIVAMAEIKCRNYVLGTYPTLKISADKIAEAVKLTSVMGVPALLVVRLQDCLLWHEVSPPYPAEMWGRGDRGDPDDVEPCCVIRFSAFKRIKIEADDDAEKTAERAGAD